MCRPHVNRVIFKNCGVFIASIVLYPAYSGVESALQTAGLVRTWKEIEGIYFSCRQVGLVIWWLPSSSVHRFPHG
jgi:hypothetical protein